jgi:hypothetical protein
MLISVSDLTSDVGIGLPGVTTAQSESLHAPEIVQVPGLQLGSSEYALSIKIEGGCESLRDRNIHAGNIQETGGQAALGDGWSRNEIAVEQGVSIQLVSHFPMGRNLDTVGSDYEGLEAERAGTEEILFVSGG